MPGPCREYSRSSYLARWPVRRRGKPDALAASSRVVGIRRCLHRLDAPPVFRPVRISAGRVPAPVDKREVVQAWLPARQGVTSNLHVCWHFRPYSELDFRPDFGQDSASLAFRLIRHPQARTGYPGIAARNSPRHAERALWISVVAGLAFSPVPTGDYGHFCPCRLAFRPVMPGMFPHFRARFSEPLVVVSRRRTLVVNVRADAGPATSARRTPLPVFD